MVTTHVFVSHETCVLEHRVNAPTDVVIFLKEFIWNEITEGTFYGRKGLFYGYHHRRFYIKAWFVTDHCLLFTVFVCTCKRGLTLASAPDTWVLKTLVQSPNLPNFNFVYGIYFFFTQSLYMYIQIVKIWNHTLLQKKLVLSPVVSNLFPQLAA